MVGFQISNTFWFVIMFYKTSPSNWKKEKLSHFLEHFLKFRGKFKTPKKGFSIFFPSQTTMDEGGNALLDTVLEPAIDAGLTRYTVGRVATEVLY